MSSPITVAVLTVSDRCSRGEAVDTSGPALAAMAVERLGWKIAARGCVPDEVKAIGKQLTVWTTTPSHPDLILTTGGTGLASRDVTPEATTAVLHRPHSALMELARLRCLQKTPRAYLSRGVAGTIGRTLIINLPGSQRGATEMFEALLDVLPHAIAMLRDEPADHPVRNASK
jgi:molybdenum cofactor synthesis domain-containing protein